MTKTIKLFIKLCFFKISPEDLPYSLNMLINFIVLNAITIYISFSVIRDAASVQVIGAILGSFILSVGFVYLVLKIKKMEVRLTKVLLALFGVELFFFFVSFVFVQAMAQAGGIALPFALALTIWNYAVKTYVFSIGFEISRLMGFFMAVSYEIVRTVPFFPIMAEFLQKVQEQGGVQ